jgi:hypothetical protein
MEVIQTEVINWYILSDKTLRGDVNYGESNYRVYYFKIYSFDTIKKLEKAYLASDGIGNEYLLPFDKEDGFFVQCKKHQARLNELLKLR